MTTQLRFGVWPLLFLLFAGCTASRYPLDRYDEVRPAAAQDAPAPDPAVLSKLDAAQVARGRYLVEMIGCGACHTHGAIVGQPDPARLLAGSRIGIAYTNPLKDRYPGVVYPPNLTPDRATGLGGWSDAEIAAAIRQGVTPGGHGRLIVMGWPLYQRLSDEDVGAIVSYLRSIPPVRHQVPPQVPPGAQAPAPFVHFGMYRSKG